MSPQPSKPQPQQSQPEQPPPPSPEQLAALADQLRPRAADSSEGEDE
jgi:hypothetical protein